jgi:membrane-bound lytic murein transglycosylase D
MWRYLLLLIAGMLVLSGCTNNLAKKDQTGTAGGPDNIVYGDDWDFGTSPGSAQPPHTLSPPESDIVIWQQLINGFQLDDVQHPSVEKEIRRFSQRTASLQRQLGQARPYLFYLLQEIEKYNMPTEIALLPGVESGYRGDVFSRHGAAGIWQFMPTTGTYFGLKQDAWYDARQDFPQATDAALLYLRKLHKRFDNDWLLAIASYNAGGGTVSRAIRKNLDQNRPIDFWSLDLPAETETYVPRLLALAKLVGHAEQYGMKLPNIHNQAHFARVRIKKQLDLSMAAQLAGMSTEELLEFNPGFKRWATHPDRPHDLLLPVEKADGFREKLARLPADQWVRTRRYHIEPGDNLGRIARKHGISVKDLKQANHLPNNNIRAGDYLTIPVPDTISIARAQKTKTSPQNRKVHYQVVKGDSLYRIARQFSVQVSDLKKWNRLNGTYIKPGQELTVLAN